MKYRFFSGMIALGLLATSGSAFAKRKYGMAGCGLGSVIMGKKGQISAATTNGLFGSQPFAITSGTSNCVPDKVESAMLEQEHFLTANLTILQKEMAQGGGETVGALSEVFGCEGNSKDVASQVLCQNHDEIFSQPGIENIRDAATKALQANAATAEGCQRLVM